MMKRRHAKWKLVKKGIPKVRQGIYIEGHDYMRKNPA